MQKTLQDCINDYYDKHNDNLKQIVELEATLSNKDEIIEKLKETILALEKEYKDLKSNKSEFDNNQSENWYQLSSLSAITKDDSVLMLLLYC